MFPTSNFTYIRPGGLPLIHADGRTDWGLARTSGFLPQRPTISFLCARTVKETLLSYIFVMIWCSSVCALRKYGFCRVGCCVRYSAKNQGKEKKEILGTPTCKSKTSERAVPQIIWRFANASNEILWIFRMTCSTFDELLFTIEGICTTRRKTGSNSKVRNNSFLLSILYFINHIDITGVLLVWYYTYIHLM
jgi:hypothetical protein